MSIQVFTLVAMSQPLRDNLIALVIILMVVAFFGLLIWLLRPSDDQ